RSFGECFTQNIKYLAPVCLTHLLELLQQSVEHLTFASVRRDDIPQSADFPLADAVDTAEPLLDSVWVPWQVIIDHQMRGLQIQTLTGGVGGEQYLAGGILSELLSDLTTIT